MKIDSLLLPSSFDGGGRGRPPSRALIMTPRSVLRLWRRMVGVDVQVMSPLTSILSLRGERRHWVELVSM